MKEYGPSGCELVHASNAGTAYPAAAIGSPQVRALGALGEVRSAYPMCVARGHCLEASAPMHDRACCLEHDEDLRMPERAVRVHTKLRCMEHMNSIESLNVRWRQFGLPCVQNHEFHEALPHLTSQWGRGGSRLQDRTK